MSKTLPYGIPAIEGLKDTYLRSIVQGLFNNVRSINDNTPSNSELQSAGVIAFDEDNLMYSPLKPKTSASASSYGLATSGLLQILFTVTTDLAAGTYLLDLELPANAVVEKAWYEVITAFASATSAAKIALGVNTDHAAGLLAATVISTSGTVGMHDCIPNGTAATFTTKTTAARSLQLTVSVETVTAGVLRLFVRYFVSG